MVGDAVYSLFPGNEFNLLDSVKNAAIAGFFNAFGPTVKVDNKLLYGNSFYNFIKMPEFKKDLIKTAYAGWTALTAQWANTVVDNAINNTGQEYHGGGLGTWSLMYE